MREDAIADSKRSPAKNDEGTPESITVLIVDDHPLVRAGARAMLNVEGIQVIGEATTAEEAINKTIELNPDVVLMDLQLAEEDGIVATIEIKKQVPETSVIIVTGSENRESVRRSVEAGATGYILKGASREMLVQAVRFVQAGGSLIDNSMLAALAEDANREAGESGPTEVNKLMASLSPREVEVLRYLAQGLTNKEIASEMHYSVGTVKNVVQRIIEKLSVSDRTQAAVYAVRAGLDVE